MNLQAKNIFNINVKKLSDDTREELHKYPAPKRPLIILLFKREEVLSINDIWINVELIYDVKVKRSVIIQLIYRLKLDGIIQNIGWGIYKYSGDEKLTPRDKALVKHVSDQLDIIEDE